MAQADVTGRGLAEALVPAAVHAGGEVYDVRPPTIREAIELSALAVGVAAGEEHIRALYARLASWLPAALLEELGELSGREFVRAVLTMLDLHAAKIQLPKPKGKKEGERKRAEPQDFRLLLSDYCQVYGGDPWTVYDATPWPFFVAMQAVRDSATARELLRLAEVEILPHTTAAAERFKALEQLARGPRAPGPDPTAESVTASPEEVAQGRARLRRFMGVD